MLFEFFPAILPPFFPTTRLLVGFLVLCVFPLFLTLMNDSSLGLNAFVIKSPSRSFKKDIHCKDDFLTLSVVLNHHNQHIETYQCHYQCLELWAVNSIEQLCLPFNLKPQIHLVKISYNCRHRLQTVPLIITNILFRKPFQNKISSCTLGVTR